MASNERVIEDRLFIGGEWVVSSSSASYEAFDPTLGVTWADVVDASAADVDAAVAAARAAFEGPWRRMNGQRRGELMNRLADLLERDAEALGRMETRDNGKLAKETVSQIRFAARNYRYFAGIADKLLGEVIPLDHGEIFDYLVREPLGVCVMLTAWNSPLQFVANKLAPALATGNTAVIKPSEFGSVSVVAFARLVAEAGFPPGVINVVTGRGPVTGQALSSHRGVDLISLTGGPPTGRVVAAAAAANLTRTVMELGGKSPHIVFADADLDRALPGVLSGIFGAAGQTCIAGSRLLLQSSIYESFLERLAERTRAIRVGAPLDDETQMGPIANRPQLQRIKAFIRDGIGEGAELVCGGVRAEVPEYPNGLFIEPTIFAAASGGAQVARVEAFGPVLSVLRFENDDEAISIANDTDFGLAAGVWTSDIKRAFRITRSVRAGTVWVNTYRTVSAAAPFGGFKQSGYGRERGLEALREYTATKNVMIDLSDDERDPFVQRT